MDVLVDIMIVVAVIYNIIMLYIIYNDCSYNIKKTTNINIKENITPSTM